MPQAFLIKYFIKYARAWQKREKLSTFANWHLGGQRAKFTSTPCLRLIWMGTS